MKKSEKFQSVGVAVFILFITTGNGYQDENSKFTQEASSCGTVPAQNTLSGPGLTSPVDVPWSVHITRRSETRVDFTFAGILLTPSLILASANYLLDKGTTRLRIEPLSFYTATLGTRFFGYPVHDGKAVTRALAHIQIHPGFDPGNAVSKEPYWMHRLKDFALFHLQKPVESSHVAPICFPERNDSALLQFLKSPSIPAGKEELILTGWKRDVSENVFLRLKILDQTNCLQRWLNQDETKLYPYRAKWCAVVGNENNHSDCINKDVGGVREIDGAYYFAGIVDEFYSNDRVCSAGSVYFFRDYGQETLEWIENNVKCGGSNFTCDTGDCVPLSKVCNQTPDCPDGSDEEPIFCRALRQCGANEFPCGVYGRCIPKEQVGDGVEHCENGEDEIGYQKKVPTIEIVAGLILTFAVISAIFLFIWRKHVKVLKKTIRNLTNKEVDEFLRGMSTKRKSRKSTSHSADNPFESQPWNIKFNISLENIKIGDEINRGNFGVVYKAFLTNSNKNADVEQANSEVPVAVKTNLATIDVYEFKAILCELKILAYVGEHANVLKFHGACIDNIKQREVYLVVELCVNGSLLDYLRKNGIYFADSSEDEEDGNISSDYQYDNSQYGFLNLYDLILWSTQIASGMEYLASKMVVHGDLAARNLLLSPNLDIKISDFGLSKQLGCTGIYVKSSEEPVPWKWLSIEAFTSNTLSEKTDVWAYSVCLWEIFSLGQVPYGSVKFDDNFLKNLDSGLRLEIPDHATVEIYDLMSTCWNASPEERPTFAELRDKFTQILHRYAGSSKRGSGSTESKEINLNYFRVSEE